MNIKQGIALCLTAMILTLTATTSTAFNMYDTGSHGTSSQQQPAQENAIYSEEKEKPADYTGAEETAKNDTLVQKVRNLATRVLNAIKNILTPSQYKKAEDTFGEYKKQVDEATPAEYR